MLRSRRGALTPCYKMLWYVCLLLQCILHPVLPEPAYLVEGRLVVFLGPTIFLMTYSVSLSSKEICGLFGRSLVSVKESKLSSNDLFVYCRFL